MVHDDDHDDELQPAACIWQSLPNLPHVYGSSGDALRRPVSVVY
jgi:hypothetical protein